MLGGRNKLIHGLDAETGQELWTVTTRARVDASPAVIGDRVYVGSGDGRLYVLDLGSGSILEDFDSAGPAARRAAGVGHLGFRVLVGHVHERSPRIYRGFVPARFES